MIVYSHSITNRLRYTCNFIGNELFGNPLIITSDKDEFSSHPHPRINYSDYRINASDLWIHPHPLLTERGIKVQSVDCFETDGFKALFKTAGDIPFDIFAACFYLLSRYEEWLPHQKDSYGRFAHENSIAFREKFLDLPLINIWMDYLRERIKKRVPSLAVHQPVFSFLPTYDIDEAYSFRDKQWWRSIGGAIKDLVKGKIERVSLRTKVLVKKADDPFDSYEWMDSLHERQSMHPHYFFLVASKTGKYDKNILPTESSMQTLVRDQASKYSIGLHPSWQSHEKPELIKSEKETLEKISGQKIISSRQHFIKMSFPDTYRNLIKSGILKDFSMGYGSINGFRASVSSPYYWYDLGKEESTSLLLHPFCYMDANSFFEQKQTPEQALDEMRYYHNTIKQVNGMFIMIWHNTFLGTDKMFSGWRDGYEKFIEENLQP